MIHVTFLSHSGFLVELDTVCLLFDWWKGILPPLPPKPLLVFASHRHEDHFSPQIFSLNREDGSVQFLLGHDIRLTPRNLARWQLSPAAAERCHSLRGNQQFSPLPGVLAETLSSTDEGVAFLVSAEGHTIFHAGDLNWWHWEEESHAWNRNMEVNFKSYMEPLRRRQLDLALFPVDPRLGSAGFWGGKYLLDLAEVTHFLPMHQWDDYGYTQTCLAQYPAYSARVTPVSTPGQTFTFP